MISERYVIELREKLLQRREEITRLRDSIRSSWGELQEPEQELEESASKRTMAGGLEQIDYRTIEELRNIDTALERMDRGEYGRCETCGRPIGRERLSIIPWVLRCVDCAELGERLAEKAPEAGEEETDRMPLPANDAEWVERIWDALDSEDSLQTEGLEIACTDGVVQIGGFVPDRRHHQLILEILEESLGISDILDNIEVETDRWDAEGDDEAQPH